MMMFPVGGLNYNFVENNIDRCLNSQDFLLILEHDLTCIIYNCLVILANIWSMNLFNSTHNLNHSEEES